MLAFALPQEGVPLALTARALAHELLPGDPRRLHHVAGAARVATFVAHRLKLKSADAVIAAAWLHDIGYSTDLVESGFHPLDGARYLRANGWPDGTVSLVAHHSHSRITAPFYGVADELSAIPEPPRLDGDILAFADVASGADGNGATIDRRLADQRGRHRSDTRIPDEARERRYRALSASAQAVMQALLDRHDRQSPHEAIGSGRRQTVLRTAAEDSSRSPRRDVPRSR